ncbi:septation ring formation regulator [Natronobacillus azotifigens]|uniref:Septation ring formation regulator EzrA n=1 Tax=Natronobacillus azotifigens TaxID=472978 RepID=A0A9J6RD40_9BACI|nr:septation ring formation regulator EzrA [Natronobacillus azotifigens]MCZ0703212.1 septation ring formation regulator EzrA [Natronobacillus azotifigens]
MGENTVAYIIGFILIIIALIIVGLILRKKVYDEVDRLEAWKMDIMNRSVTKELQRVKALNLSGETQEKFESWKETWDQILTRTLPDIEEFLLDAEEAADRFRMGTAKKNLKAVEQTLNDIEETIERMYTELDALLDSEKQSRKEVAEVLPLMKELRNLLIQNRHLYGQAEYRFEKEINEQQELLDEFYSASDSGNYYEARKIIDSIRQNLNLLFEKIEEFPIIYKKCKREVPDQIHELLIGIQEMKEEGYRIEHHNLEKELKGFQEQLEKQVELLEKKDVDDLYSMIETIEERISEIYLLLEKEAQAKTYLEKHLDPFDNLIQEVAADFDATNEEVTELQKTYYLEESDMELYRNLEKWIHQLERQYHQLTSDLEADKETYISMRDQLESSYQDLKKLKESHQEFKAQVRTIRKEELEAKKKIQQLKRELFDANRKLQKSNLPGVPSFVWNTLDEATEKSEQVLEKLAQQPLDMGAVSHALKEAEISVQTMLEKTNLLIEQAYLVERVIQYANRYRSRYPLLAANLLEAEELFRSYAYEQALETATHALEEIEPGAIKRLESRIKIPS